MLLADSSAWVEFLRSTGSPVNARMREAIRADEVVVIDPVLLEVMAGSRPGQEEQLKRLLAEQDYRALVPREDWFDAAWIHRHCRRAGLSVRKPLDCLIAAVAIRAGLPLLAADRDFDSIGRVAPLQLVEVS